MQDETQGPIRTLSYRLSRADALAYLLLERELTGWEKFRFMAFLACGGVIAGLLPDDMAATGWWLAVMSTMLLMGILATIWSNAARRIKAATMALPKGDVVLEQWDDHLVERSAIAARRVAFEAVAQVISTEAHVFVRQGVVPLIVPRTAFSDEADMQAFAGDIDAGSERAQP